MSEIWIKQGSKTFGPLGLKQLKGLLHQNRINEKHLFAESKDGPWLPVYQVQSLVVLSRDVNNWYWLKSGFVEDSREGPVAGSQLILLLDKKKIKAKTPVLHPLFTGNAWMKMSDTQLAVVYDAVLKQRELKRQQQVEQDRLKAEQERRRQQQIRQEQAEARRKEEERQQLEEARKQEQEQAQKQLVSPVPPPLSSTQFRSGGGVELTGGFRRCWYCGCPQRMPAQCEYCRVLPVN